MKKEPGVSEHPNRSEDVDRLLRSVLGGATPATPACVDAERLAAWSAGTLSRRDAADVEAHAADCARCQAMMAVLVRAEPERAASSVPLWRWGAPRWLVPIGALAVLALWAVLPPSSRDATPVQTVARVESSDVPAPQAPVPAEPMAADEPRDEPVDSGARQSLASEQPSPRPEVPTVAPRSDATEESTTPEITVGPAAAPVELKPEPPPRLTSVVRGAGAAPAFLVIEIPFVDRTTDAQERVAAGPSPSVRWRIVGGTRVERSTAGNTWETVFEDPVITLTAGSAPSGTVCWLVGRDGVVLRTTDGVGVERVSFPAATDLSSVDASDASTATVTTADGRAFTTTDGGSTWR